MAGREPFQYALVRVVPRVERGESLNAGVVLFCRPRRYLAARTWLDEAALAVLSPGCDPAEVQPHLRVVEAVAAGDRDAGGAVAALPQSERFHWLTAPASTIVQPSPVHTGLTDDPAAQLDHLFATLVAR
ncbi:MAG TPA: DUF3037 domain-containing protein [Solirubrobacteraceae bacterium]|nr:DUF3037 domain-containing protein [Solirubrobacteraceae bacterium]